MPPAAFPPPPPPSSSSRGLGLLLTSPTFSSPVTLSQSPRPCASPCEPAGSRPLLPPLLPAGGSQRRLDLVGVGGERQLEESLRAPMLASTYLERRGRQPQGGNWGVRTHLSVGEGAWQSRRRPGAPQGHGHPRLQAPPPQRAPGGGGCCPSLPHPARVEGAEAAPAVASCGWGSAPCSPRSGSSGTLGGEQGPGAAGRRVEGGGGPPPPPLAFWWFDRPPLLVPVPPPPTSLMKNTKGKCASAQVWGAPARGMEK